MGQHRPLGHPGGAAGVLQQRQVIQAALRLDGRQLVAQPQRLHKAHLVRLTAVELRVAVIIHTGDDQGVDLGGALDLAHQRYQLVEHDHGASAGVGKLVAGFVIGVLRVGIDDHQAGTQSPEDGDGVLQQVGQLNGQAVTRLQTSVLTQIARKGVGAATQLIKGQSVGAARKCRTVAIAAAGLFQDIEDRGVTQFCQLRTDGIVLRCRHLSLLFLDYCFALRNEIPKRC